MMYIGMIVVVAVLLAGCSVEPSDAEPLDSAGADPQQVFKEVGTQPHPTPTRVQAVQPFPTNNSKWAYSLPAGLNHCLTPFLQTDYPHMVFAEGSQFTDQERRYIIDCLGGSDTLLKLFVTGMTANYGVLQPETTSCIREAATLTGLRRSLRASFERLPSQDDKSAAITFSLLTFSCISDDTQHPESVARVPSEKADFARCVIDQMGGPEKLRAQYRRNNIAILEVADSAVLSCQ